MLNAWKDKKTAVTGKEKSMAAAEQIMKGKAFIRREMERQLPKQQSDALWEKAEKRLAL